MPRSNGQQEGPSAWILTEPNDSSPVILWGLPTTERLRRAAERAGIPPTDIGIGPADEIRTPRRTCLLLRSDYAVDDRLIQALVTSTNTVLRAPKNGRAGGEGASVAVHVPSDRLSDGLTILRGNPDTDGAPPAQIQYCDPAELAGFYAANLRRSSPPYLFHVRSDTSASLENRIFDASYKGVTDLVTKWVWPMPARFVTRLLARRGIHPNTVTALSWVLVVITTLLFSQGRFAWGLAAAWTMTFLDTVDGKLARVTLRSSKLGNFLDHGLDLLHPPFWYLAWAIGLPTTTVPVDLALAVVLIGYVLGRAIEGIFLLAFKTEIHCWHRVDSSFRAITARRNPNLILLTLALCLGRPDLGLAALALWTALSLGFHTVRLGQATARRWRGETIQSWLEREAACEPTQ